MNKVHNIVWNRVSNQWTVVPETAKANGKASRVTGSARIKLTALVSTLTALAIAPQAAQADCTIGSTVYASGATVDIQAGETANCSGTQVSAGAGIVFYGSNATLNNTGTITSTTPNFIIPPTLTPLGSYYSGVGTTNIDGLTFHNSGKVSVQLTTFGNPTDSRAAIVLGGYPQTKMPNWIYPATSYPVLGSSNSQFINTTTGEVRIQSTGVASNQTVNGTGGSVVGVMVGSLLNDSADNRIDNAGLVSISSPSVGVRALMIAGNRSKVTNSGTVEATTAGATAPEATGILIRGTQPVTGVADLAENHHVINSGTITVGGAAQSLYGIRATYGTQGTGFGGSVNTVIDNSGKISLTSASGTAKAYGIAVEGDAVNAVVNHTGDITITGGTGALQTSRAGIYRTDFGADDSQAFTINTSGNITADNASYAIYTGNTTDSITMTAGKIDGDISTGAGKDTFTANGGALVGNTLMGSGDDVATLTGTVDVTSAPQFDGGAGADVLNVDGLNLRGFTAASNDGTGNLTETNNSNLTGWETINVKNAGTLKLSNNLFTAANVGTLNIDASSTLDLKGNSPDVFTIYGDVNNSGMMTMADGSADDVTTITGNYTGVAGSQYNIDTVLGNDASATDKLIVNGNTAGATTLSVTNVGGAGAQTVEGIQVVQVDGASSGTFALTSPVQAGSYEYQLFQGGTSTPTDGDWYLRSTLLACEITNTCPVVPPVEPEPPVIPIYRPGVANYVVAQTSNADLGYLALDTLHQRIGEQRTLTTDNPQTWVRAIAGYTSNNGKNRFEYDQTTVGFQIGRDLLHDTTGSGTQQRAGLTTQYLRGNVDTRDRVRPIARLSEDTGHIQSTAYGLGAYYTRMTNQGAYVDLVAQVNRLDNQFNDAYGSSSKQKGWQVGLSAEVGKPVAQIKGWTLEPQAQLSYLHAHYGAFADQFSKISSLNADHLRARLGLRVYKERHPDSSKTAQYYAIANIHHDLISPESVELAALNSEDRVGVSERYDRTSWEVGAGVQHPLSKNTYFYGDARYEQSFGDRKHSGKITFGIKSSF